MIDQNIMTDKFASDILERLSAKQKHLSKKYDLNEINDLATSSNFKTAQLYGYYELFYP